MDLITLALAKKYTKNTVVGLGAIKGAPCTIKSTSTDSDGNTIITFSWTSTSGTEQTTNVTVSKGDQGIQGIQGIKGDKGDTPMIDPITFHWIIGGVDTGVCAKGSGGGAESYNDLTNLPIQQLDGTVTAVNASALASGIYKIQGSYTIDGTEYSDANNNALISVSQEADTIMISDPDQGFVTYTKNSEGEWIERNAATQEITEDEVNSLFE